MPKEVIAALIALGGVFVSVFVSYITSYRKANLEIQKLRAEIQHQFSSKLFEKRLELYPELYNYLSKFIRIIQFNKISKKAVQDLISEIHEWTSKNAILFSGPTGSISYKLRLFLIELSQKSDMELQQEFSSKEALSDLRRRVQELELALKNELGIYAFETPTESKVTRNFSSYREIEVWMNERRKRRR